MFRNFRTLSIFFHISIMLLMIGASFIQPPSVQAQSYNENTQTKDEGENKDLSPAGYLNSNGTLKLDASLSGSFDLQGWDVQMDPTHGPIFQPENAPSAVGLGQWASLGGGMPASPNSYVRAVAISGTDVYVAGSFTDLDNNDALDYIAKWNGTSWSALGTNGAGNGSIGSPVDKILINGTDIYIAGSFSNVNNNGTVLNTADYIAKWNGSNWSALGSDGFGNGSINGQINALAISGSTIYVGGQFTDVKNSGLILTAADYVAKWDGSNWSALGSNGAANGALTSAQIYAIGVSGSNVYVGGQFTNVNNNGTVLNAADYVAKWDGTNWSALSSDGVGNGSLNAYVRAIAVSGSTIYVGGLFSDVNNGGTVLGAADYITKWDGTNWSALSTNGSGGGSLSSQVLGIMVSGSNVYVSGIFENVNNGGTILGAADYITKWDGTNWSALGSNGAGNGSLNYYLSAIAVSGSNVYLGGFFTNVNNNGTNTGLSYLALFNGTDWGPVDPSLQGAIQSHITTVAVHGTDIYVGGTFINAGNIPEADYIAKWDGVNWSALSSNGNGDGAITNQAVTDIAISGSDVYVGGTFGNINDNGNVLTAADNIAKWDGTHWSALGSNGAGDGSINSNVHTLTVSGSNLYVGGIFENVNNNGTVLNAADYVAKWDGVNWSALGSNGAGDGSLNAWVGGIAVNGADVYVIGAFTNVNNNGTVLTAADTIAKWNGTNWSALSSNGAGEGSFNGFINAIAINGSNLYVGGNFVFVNDNGVLVPSSGYIAKWDGTHWSGLGSDGAGGSSISGTVNAITISGTDVYAGGYFSNVNNNGTIIKAADYIAKWDGANWSALGFNGGNNGAIPTSPSTQVRALDVGADSLYIGGTFSNVNNNGTPLPYADYVAAYGIPNAENLINVTIGGTPQGSYYLNSGENERASYQSLNNGPVKVEKANLLPVIASERVAYSPDGGTTWTSFDEMMGLPSNQLTDTYYFPYYNNVEMNTQLRFGNVGTSNTTVTVTIGGVVQGNYLVTPNQSMRLSYNLNAGPVKVQSSGNVPIIASIRFANIESTSPLVVPAFTEMMGLPGNQLTTTYVFPHYNNVEMNTQLRFGNVGTSATNVTVTIGGVVQGVYPVAPSQSVRLFYNLNSGPVKVQSSGGVPIIASMRFANIESESPLVISYFSEMLGLPQASLSTNYWFPIYDNVTHNMQLRFGNMGATNTTVTVRIGGIEQGSYVVLPNQSQRLFYTLNDGPVQVQSSGGVPIIASIRFAYIESEVPLVVSAFSEMLGLPAAQLSSTYLFPWYNNEELDTQMRIAVP